MTAPRKTTSRPAKPTVIDAPPGPIRLEIRVNDKIMCAQPVHSYTIDQQDSLIVVRGYLTPSNPNTDE